MPQPPLLYGGNGSGVPYRPKPVSDPQLIGDRRYRLPGGQVIWNVHIPEQCAGQPCCIHNPSDHPMRGWVMSYSSSGIMYRQNPDNGELVVDPDDPAALPQPEGEIVYAYRFRFFVPEDSNFVLPETEREIFNHMVSTGLAVTERQFSMFRWVMENRGIWLRSISRESGGRMESVD